MSLRERLTGKKVTPSIGQARRAGRSALMGEGAEPIKYVPNQDELLKDARTVPNNKMMLLTSANRYSPIAQTTGRALRDIVVIGNTYIGVVDKSEGGKFTGTELLALPYGSASQMRTSVFLRQTITPGARDSFLISRDFLAEKGIADPQVSNGVEGAGHLEVMVHGDTVHYGDNDSKNGTRLITGSSVARSENPEIEKLADDLRANPQYLQGTMTGHEAVISPLG